MSVQLAGRLSALLFCFLICVGCGDVYRPTIIPQPVQPPDPKNAHAAFTVNQNGAFNPGTGLQVDVSGDSAAGVTKVANLPVHAVVQGGRVWVVNRGSNSVSAFTVASGSTVPIGTAIAINLPSSPIVVPPGSPTNDIVASPNFVYTTETATVYVASAFVHSQNPNLNDLNGTVTVINSITNTISNAVAVGMYPIAMTETPTNTATTGLVKKLYVVNRDSNNITVVQAADQTVLTTLATGNSPRWVVSRADGARVYVLSNDGTITNIDSLSPVDTVIGSVSIGAGADSFYYDSRTNRLYIPNPTNSTVTILDASLDSLPVLATINLTAAIPSGTGAPCPATGCSPVSVTALPDGSRAYVASYYIDSTSANCQQTACLQAQVTVIDEATNQVTKSIPLPQVSVSPVGNCGTPSQVRFRIAATTAVDGSRVYVSSCDAGRVASINPVGDVYFAAIPAPVSAFSPTLLNITSATQNGAETTYSYTYSQPVANTPIYLGLMVTITGMSQAADNGTFTVTGLGNGTFTVSNPSGVSSATESGTGIGQPPPQNPVFMLTGS
jgi:YVTN family beta-propeller protein